MILEINLHLSQPAKRTKYLFLAYTAVHDVKLKAFEYSKINTDFVDMFSGKMLSERWYESLRCWIYVGSKFSNFLNG